MTIERAHASDSTRLDSVAAVFAVDLDQCIVSSTPAADAMLGGQPLVGRRCYDVMRSLDDRNGAQCRLDCVEVTDARCGRTPYGSSLWGTASGRPRAVTTVVEARDGASPVIIHVLRATEELPVLSVVEATDGCLTRRQVESLRLLARGVTPKEIARTLGISTVTVRNHLQTAMERLGAHTRLEAVLFATRAGLIESFDSWSGSTESTY